jgi:heat-inducible transcriptional repressor
MLEWAVFDSLSGPVIKQNMANTSKVGELDDRGKQILKFVVGMYIQSGEPVGSRTISKTLARTVGWQLSPATIRNIMADLEDVGYLSQPHTSAGRVPTEKAYRFYVDCLGSSPRPTRSAEAYIKRTLGEAGTPEELMAAACFLLSDISKNVGIVVSAPTEISILQHIEFIRLDHSKILIILVSQGGLLQQKVIRVDEPYTQDELTRAGNYLVEQFSGHTLLHIRQELVGMMARERMQYDRMLRNLLKKWSEALDRDDSSPDESVYVQGTGNILSNVEPGDIGRMQELFRVFEEKGRLVAILTACLGRESDDRVQVMIGSELGHPCLEGFTVITSPYLRCESESGFMGIIGPTRMEYRKGISVVSYLADLCGRMFAT